ncbi:hypothetical protein DdX_18542 [Ditylenchus destructor]|uniref:Uncharacterized protein n=1 Tax=Ditylenchus destructor TaxID=166010 RepID=A0AAD4MKI9_9BILA|nr:hypothetical protein DdX_18542 [Ditylenchus destructor]
MASENETNANKFAKLQEMVEEMKSDHDRGMKDNSSQISELRERNRKLEKENEMLKADLKDCENNFEETLTMAVELQSELVNREGVLKQYSARIKNVEEENNRLKNEIRSLLQHLDTVQQNTNSAGQKCSVDYARNANKHYSLAEMRPYLGPTVRIIWTSVKVAGDSTYNPDHIVELESITYLWRDGNIGIWNVIRPFDIRIVAEDFQPILNSSTILKCQNYLYLNNAHISFRDYKILYSVNQIVIDYESEKINPHYLPEFLEQPGVKPVIVLNRLHPESINSVLNQLSKTFSSAVSPNAFTIRFSQCDKSLTEFREVNYKSREKLQLKKKDSEKDYTLERCSLPPVIFEVLYYLNRDQLERFSIVCRPFKNFIERHLGSKPYRIFDQLLIYGGMHFLVHNNVRWHPNRNDYSAQQFLARQECSIGNRGYSFAEMRPYLGPTVRIKWTFINVAGGVTYNPGHIAEMESIAYLWHDAEIFIWNSRNDGSRIDAEHFQPILNSPAILQCQYLKMDNAQFSFKDHKTLYTVNLIEINYENAETDPNYWPQFLEQPGVKPLVVLRQLNPESVVKMLERLYKDFSSAVSPKAYKIIFAQNDRLLIKSIVESFKNRIPQEFGLVNSIIQSFKVVYSYSQSTVPLIDEELIAFQDKNKTSGEKWEFKKPDEFALEYPEYELNENNKYVLERSSI